MNGEGWKFLFGTVGSGVEAVAAADEHLLSTFFQKEVKLVKISLDDALQSNGLIFGS